MPTPWSWEVLDTGLGHIAPWSRASCYIQANEAVLDLLNQPFIKHRMIHLDDCALAGARAAPLTSEVYWGSFTHETDLWRLES